jgi:hypothetical protein
MWTLLLAVLLSAITALPGNRANRERLCAAVYTFLACTFTVFAGGWLMYLIHG